MKKYLAASILVLTFLCLPPLLTVASQIEATTIVLAGDIGGTNARLQLSQFKNGKKHVLAKKTYKVAEYDNIAKVITVFLSEFNYGNAAINNVCFAVAGPIKNNKVQFTNAKWSIDAEQLKTTLKIDNIKLINDFEAIGYGIETLTAEDLYPLQKGTPEKNGLKAFLGAGTGLGVGFAYFAESQYVVYPTEGGHTSFTPTDDIQMAILKYLHTKYNSNISTERLLSGPGIVNIYNYFREVNPFNDIESNQLKKSLEDSSTDAGKEITDFALEHPNDQMAAKTLETFVNIYGAKSGDLAFTLLPRGGLYIVGAIAAKVLTKKQFAANFMRAFGDKDSLSYMLKDLPVWVILNTEVGLQGAENYALKLALVRTKMSDTQENGLQSIYTQ